MDSVVAAAAAVCRHREVIEPRRCPGIGGVTGLAGITGGQVSAPLATCRYRIVATDTAAADLQVIDPQDRQPGQGRVAALAARAAAEVVRRLAQTAPRPVAAHARRACRALVIETHGVAENARPAQ